MTGVLETAGPFSEHIARLFWIFVGISAAVYILVIGFLVHALRRAKRTGERPRDHRSSRAALRYIGAASGITALILVVMAVADFSASRALARAPEDAMRVRITAHQWWWEVEYLDGVPADRVRTANELHIPVGKPVALELRSDDVIHSFWVPSLQGKRDLIPGYTNNLQIQASRPGVYPGECAEFCGFQHAHMRFAVYAREEADYQRWRQEQLTPAREPADPRQQRGREVFLTSTCAQCHAIVGTEAGATLGPDLTHVGSRAQIAAGTLANNPANLAAWIREPQRFKPGTRMPAAQLADDDLEALVHYLGSLR